MRSSFFLALWLTAEIQIFAQPVFKNPGIPEHESFILHEYLDPDIGYVTSKIEINLKERDHLKYYEIEVHEGGYYLNRIEVRYDDLTTISEKRYDLKTNTLVHSYSKKGDTVYFFVREKGINRKIITDDNNIYSSLAYFVSFRGFPFETGRSVTFKTYMYMYGDVLTMKLKNITKEQVKVPAGTFDCYVLELSVGGWQSVFARDKYYLYFDFIVRTTVTKPVNRGSCFQYSIRSP